MRDNFDITTKWLLVHEGGYINHPKDPGGATNRGVTQRTYDGYRVRKGLSKRSVREVKEAEVLEIYKSQYWDAIYGDTLPSGLDYAVYDFAVNSGSSRAIKFLQQILGVRADGVIGNITLAAIHEHEVQKLIFELCSRRFSWMKTLKTFSTFGKGWTRRVMGDVPGAQPGKDHGVVDRAFKLSRVNVSPKDIEMPTEQFAGKADEEDTKIVSATVEAVKKDDNIISIGVGAIPSTIAAIAAVPEGPLQWSLSVILVVAALGVGFLLYRKFTTRA